MSTYKELIYITNDLAKNISDDATFTEEHIAFLLNKFRVYLLKQKYDKSVLRIPQSNLQTVCVNLNPVNSIPGCEAETCLETSTSDYLRSAIKLPYTIDTFNVDVSIAKVPQTVYKIILNEPVTEEIYVNLNKLFGIGTIHLDDIGKSGLIIYETTCKDEANEMEDLLSNKYHYDIIKTGTASSCDAEKVNMIQNYSNVNLVSRYRIGYTGFSKYSKKTVYATIGGDNYLYFKVSDSSFSSFNRAYVTGVFEDPDLSYKLSECDDSACKNEETGINKCEPWDNRFPIEEGLTSQLISLVVKDLVGAAWRPKDTANNAKDDLSDLNAFVRRNMKNNIQKQLSGDDD